MTDYRELLKRYMAHIIDMESCDFLDYRGYDVELTEQELDELRKISLEVEI